MPPLLQQSQMQSKCLARIPLPNEPLRLLHSRSIIRQSQALDMRVSRNPALPRRSRRRRLRDDRSCCRHFGVVNKVEVIDREHTPSNQQCGIFFLIYFYLIPSTTLRAIVVDVDFDIAKTSTNHAKATTNTSSPPHGLCGLHGSKANGSPPRTPHTTPLNLHISPHPPATARSPLPPLPNHPHTTNITHALPARWYPFQSVWNGVPAFPEEEETQARLPVAR